MSKRDKLLLTILAIALILFLPNYFYTVNVVQDLRAAHTQQTELEQQYQSYLQKEAGLPATQKYRELLDSQLAEALPATSTLTKTYEAHYLFTKMAADHGMTLHSLQLGQFQPLTLTPLTEADFAQFANLAVNLTAEEIAAVPESAIKASSLSVSLSLEGTKQNLFRMLDALRQYSDHVVIDSISIPTMNETEAITTQISAHIYVVS